MIGIVLALGFLLLLVALQAPLIAALGVATNLLATGAAFGVGKLIFQNGHGAGLLGFEPQGFLDAWAPVFFFAMIFAISMDYTVFLLSSAKEHFDRSGDPREAMVGGLAHSGRVIFAAAAVMVAVFFTFALSGPLPPKEMGVILGRRRPARRDARPPRARADAAARLRPLGVGAPALARPSVAEGRLRPQLALRRSPDSRSGPPTMWAGRVHRIVTVHAPAAGGPGMRIVVGVDGSDEARRALAWACTEAKALGAPLHVVHVWEYPYGIAPSASAAVQSELHSSLRRDAELVLDQAVVEAREAGISVTSALLEGAAAEQLVHEAASDDLLVVGSHGRGGFAGLLLGSVGQQCALHARCPLVIVPSHTR